jgi:HlyD family secretion protein
LQIWKVQLRNLLRGLGVLAVLVGIGAWWWQAHRPPPPLVWQGYADADFVKIGPTQAGLLTEVAAGRGDEVQAGTLLFVQDETDDKAARDQAARQLSQAGAQLANLQAGGKPTEIQQAEANLRDAQATAARAAADLARDEALMRNGNSTRQTVDQRHADDLSARAKVASAEAALAQAQAPMGRATEIAAQQQAVEAAQAALAMAQWRLDQRRVTAPAGGRIADVLARPGETMSAGAPVVSLLPPGNILIRFFVAEADLARLHKGDRLSLSCDGCAKDLAGTVSFISPQAEYTPPFIYSESSRSKLVYLIEARPRPDQATRFNPGQPVDVRPVG